MNKPDYEGEARIELRYNCAVCHGSGMAIYTNYPSTGVTYERECHYCGGSRVVYREVTLDEMREMLLGKGSMS